MTHVTKQKEIAILYVGFLFPDKLKKLINNQTYPQAATQRFGEALIHTLRSVFDAENIKIISFAPINDYPNNKLIISPSSKWIINGIQAKMLSFINIIGLKHLTRFIITYIHVLKWTYKASNNRRIIITHGLVSAQLWSVYLGQLFYRSTLCTYITDDTGVSLKGESLIVKGIREFDKKIIMMALQRMSGVIAMTNKLAEKLAPGLPVSIIPAIYNFNTKLSFLDIKDISNEFNIVFSGGVNKDNGIEFLLDSFKTANKKDWRLIIAGKGDMEEEVQKAVLFDHKINYKGFVEIEELSEIYKDADVFVNLRLTSSEITDLGFPSKLIEFVGTGKPVISSNLPALTNEFRKHLIILESDDPKSSFIENLNQIQLWGRAQKENWRLSSKNFINDNFVPGKQGNLIKQFFNQIG
jgi:glycosyltransferase involved in cell wall biosynthesis